MAAEARERMLLQSSCPNSCSLATMLVQPDPSFTFAATGPGSKVGVGSFLFFLLRFQLMGPVAEAKLQAPGPKAIWSGSLKYGGSAPRLGSPPSPAFSFRLFSLRTPVVEGSGDRE